MRNSAIIALLAVASVAMAQSGTNSPYSQYGLGTLADQSLGASRAMGGIGVGLRQANQPNAMNPASYSAVDSLTMVFDVALSGQITSFKEGGRKVNANNGNFEYFVGLFRVAPKMGVSLGLLPFTNIGYNYSVASDGNTNAYNGTGGLHQAFVGYGWNVWRGLSLGANFSYLWGSYDKYVTNTNSDAYVNRTTIYYSTLVKSYKIDFGAQWQQQLNKKDVLTVGATYSLGHNLGASADRKTTNSNPQTSVAQETTHSIADAFELPHTFGAGFTLAHGTKWTVGADYTFQKWGNISGPTMNDGEGQYRLASGLYKDRHRVALGGEWTPDSESRKFLNQIHYRLGASFATPYTVVNGKDAPKELGLTAGFGIPIRNGYNSRSMLNISAGWTHAGKKDMITENTFRINIGLTFNERWFMKWKVE